MCVNRQVRNINEITRKKKRIAIDDEGKGEIIFLKVFSDEMRV